MTAFVENFTGMNPLFQAAFTLYLASFLLFLPAIPGKRPLFLKLAILAMMLAFCANTAVIADRWIEAGRAPLKTLYETLLFYPWCVTAVFFVLLGLYRVSVFGLFASAINLAGLAYACLKPDIEIINLPPALQSAWFVPHVVTYFISYAALFACFSLAILYLVFPKWRQEGENKGFEHFFTGAMNFGFISLTLGLVMGAAWGKTAWGNYWDWDPKENWALITWLIYVGALHLRFVAGWKGKRMAIICILGFLAVVFTYLGMNLLPAAKGSLHVYQ
jgi:ABC-type transport system involved in cytochrome c biogenesis permease subunit|tara:strand:- start:45 stop:869 length:825 start_codon:yes stop_codon:yes gene_type:complete